MAIIAYELFQSFKLPVRLCEQTLLILASAKCHGSHIFATSSQLLLGYGIFTIENNLDLVERALDNVNIRHMDLPSSDIALLYLAVI